MWRSVICIGVFIILAGVFAGCKKDVNKDIENPGISFLYGANTRNDLVLRPSSSAQKISNLLVVNLRGADPAANDIHITLADKTTALLNAYNTAHGTTIEALPAALWSLPAELVIKKGEQYAYGEISVSNTSALDFNKQYAIGVTITGVSDGKNIAANLGDMFIVFRVLNILDGRYSVRGQYYNPGLGNVWHPHRVDGLELWTTGANSAKMVWPPNLPLGASPQYELVHNPSTGGVVVFNPDPGTIVVSPLASLNADVFNNRRDAGTGTIYIAYGYNFGPGYTFIPGTSRAWIDTLTYLGPR